MVLTRNNAALGLMFDTKILDHKRSEVIFGSDFPLDQTDLQICLNIQRVKNCMAQGKTVILVHCAAMYESLYDLLNQHYTESGGQLYCRLAVGANSRLCPLLKEFRVVVVVDTTEAYTRLAPPLLNRFEKQVLERRHLLSPIHKDLIRRLLSFAVSLVKCEITTISVQDIQSGKLRYGDLLVKGFCGYHTGMLASLAQSIIGLESIIRNDDSIVRSVSMGLGDAGTSLDNMNRHFQTAMRQLLWCATPECVSRWLSHKQELAQVCACVCVRAYVCVRAC